MSLFFPNSKGGVVVQKGKKITGKRGERGNLGGVFSVKG
jgi:hypothetical protein